MEKIFLLKKVRINYVINYIIYLHYVVACVVLHCAHYVALQDDLKMGSDKRKSKQRSRPMVPNSHTNIKI